MNPATTDAVREDVLLIVLSPGGERGRVRGKYSAHNGVVYTIPSLDKLS